MGVSLRFCCAALAADGALAVAVAAATDETTAASTFSRGFLLLLAPPAPVAADFCGRGKQSVGARQKKHTIIKLALLSSNRKERGKGRENSSITAKTRMRYSERTRKRSNGGNGLEMIRRNLHANHGGGRHGGAPLEQAGRLRVKADEAGGIWSQFL